MEISKRKIDATAQRDGEVVDGADVNLPGVQIETRSLNAWAYRNEVDRLETRKLAAKAKDKSIPRAERLTLNAEERAAIEVEALISKCLIDVRGLTDNGRPLNFAEVCDLIRDPDYILILGACRAAAARVGIPGDLDLLEDDAGNLPAPSDGSSATDGRPASSPT